MIKTIYKIEAKKPTGRYVLAYYNQESILIEIKLIGSGWTEDMVKSMFSMTPVLEENIQNDIMCKLNYTKIL